MNSFNKGERVSSLCGGTWVYSTIVEKLEGEEKIGNLNIWPSLVDPQYKLKCDKDGKMMIQHASMLQPTESSQKEPIAASSGLSEALGQFETFNHGDNVGFSFEDKHYCGVVKRLLNEKEEVDGIWFWASKKDPQYLIECENGSEWLVPVSALQKKEKLQRENLVGKGIQQGSGFGSQTGVGFQSTESGFLGSQGTTGLLDPALAGSQGHHFSQEQGAEGRHHSQGSYSLSQGQLSSAQDTLVPGPDQDPLLGSQGHHVTGSKHTTDPKIVHTIE